MESQDSDVLIVRDVLAELFPEADALDTKTLTDIAAGKEIKYSKDEYSASLDLTQIVDLIREWAPVIFGMIGAIKTVRDLSKPADSTARPTPREVLDAYRASRKDDHEAYKLEEAADATITRYYRKE